MGRYGPTYQVVDFISRLIPKRRTPNPEALAFVHSALRFVQDLSELQEKNPRITISFHVGDGLWVYADLTSLFFVKPTQKFLLLHLFDKMCSIVPFNRKNRAHS